jgi:hydrogenase 3 maturation protease
VLCKLLINTVQAGKTTVLVGLGNVLRRDDGVGVYLAQNIHPGFNIHVINVEVGIENYIGKINSYLPDLLILMDCVFFNRRPGYSRLSPVTDLVGYTTNTHNIALKSISNLFTAQTFILGIQPDSVALGEGLSAPVLKKAEHLVQKINSCFFCK